MLPSAPKAHFTLPLLLFSLTGTLSVAASGRIFAIVVTRMFLIAASPLAVFRPMVMSSRRPAVPRLYVSTSRYTIDCVLMFVPPLN